MKHFAKYDAETGISTVELMEKGKVYRGKAKAHPDDMDVAAQYTGITIAEYRAKIKRQKYKASMAKARMFKLMNEITHLNTVFRNYRQEKDRLENELESYIQAKEKFQDGLRAIRDREGSNK